MIIVEKKHKQKSKRQCHKYPFNIQLPEMNQPTPWLRGIERPRDGHSGDISSFEVTRDTRESDPENCSKDIGIVSQQATKHRSKDSAGS